MSTVASVVALGLFLGMRRATDVDHVLAVAITTPIALPFAAIAARSLHTYRSLRVFTGLLSLGIGLFSGVQGRRRRRIVQRGATMGSPVRPARPT